MAVLVLLKPTAMSANGGKHSDTERTAHRRPYRIAAVRVASPRDLSPTELPAWLTTAPRRPCVHLPDRIANLNQRPTSCAMLRADWSSTHRTGDGTEFERPLETTVPNYTVYSRNFRFAELTCGFCAGGTTPTNQPQSRRHNPTAGYFGTPPCPSELHPVVLHDNGV